MSTQHTPGPWAVGEHPGDSSGTNWRSVNSLGGEFSPSFVCSALREDARLIAAAPDLLAALEKLVSWDDNEGKGPDDIDWAALDVAMKTARAAIQKAKGE